MITLASAVLVAAAWAEDVPPGRAVAEAAQCTACHAVPTLATPSRVESCDGCHQWVRAVSTDPARRTKALSIFPRWERYEQNVASYFDVPDLGAAFARLDPAWLARYLADPHDLRPSMPETMVRLGLDGPAIAAVAQWASTMTVAVAPTRAPSLENVVTGERLFTARGCAACHAYGGRHTGGIAAAPDLRWARERMSADMVAAWIADPTAVHPGATMPALGIDGAEVLALRDYVWLAEPGGTPATPAASSAGLPFPVPTWDAVESRVFGKICTHCHMDPAQNEGRRGPGNAGGFGWPATGLELQTYESVVANESIIVAAIERRYEEEARDHVRAGEVPAHVSRPGRPGMPLGLPALPPTDLALVKAWYAAGAPR